MKIVLFTPPDKPLLYEVNIKTYNQKAKNESRELIYKTRVEKFKDTFSGYIINFKRYDLILDNTKIHSSIDDIIILFGKLFEDINLKISQTGEILKINNFEDIQEKWKIELKYQVSKTYKGILVESMIENLDQKIENEQLFIQSLHRDPFFFSYILTINGEYKDNIFNCQRVIDNFGNFKDVEAKYKFKLIDPKNSARSIIGRGFLTDFEKKRLVDKYKLNAIDYAYDGYHMLNRQKNIDSMSISQSLIIDNELSISQKMETILI